MTKQMLASLILGYAVEEADVQPNTYYSVVYHGDMATNFGQKRLKVAKDLGKDCNTLLENIGTLSNTFLNTNGIKPAKVAKAYHTIWA